MMSTTKSDVTGFDVYTTSITRRCIDVETRRRLVVDMTPTTNSDVFSASGQRRCLNVETRRLRYDVYKQIRRLYNVGLSTLYSRRKLMSLRR